MKKLLTVGLAGLFVTAFAGVVNAETKLGLPSPNKNCFHYHIVETGEIRVESYRFNIYSPAEIGGYTFSKVKGLVPFIKENKIKGFSFKGEVTPAILKAWHKLCD